MDFLRNKYLQLVLRVIIGGLFVYASFDKLFNPAGFAEIIRSYHMLPLSLVNLFAIVIPYVELVAGAFLIFGIYKKGSSLIISLLLIVFLIALVQAKALGLENCGCFSIDSEGAKSDINIRIVEDIFMLIGSLLIFFFSEPKSKDNLKTEGE